MNFNLTMRTQHGLRALMDIGFHEKNGPVQRRHIAVRQSIPTDYMDQLLMKLRAKGLIHSLRGREGGYLLAKDADAISVWDVVEAVEEPSHVGEHLEKVGGDVAYATECLTDPAVDFLIGTVKRQLKKYTIAMFLEEGSDLIQERGLDPSEVVEFKPTKELAEKARKFPAMNRVPTQGREAYFH
jgi:Rrf2 family protein